MINYGANKLIFVIKPNEPFPLFSLTELLGEDRHYRHSMFRLQLHIIDKLIIP